MVVVRTLSLPRRLAQRRAAPHASEPSHGAPHCGHSYSEGHRRGRQAPRRAPHFSVPEPLPALWLNGDMRGGDRRRRSGRGLFWTDSAVLSRKVTRCVSRGGVDWRGARRAQPGFVARLGAREASARAARVVLAGERDAHPAAETACSYEHCRCGSDHDRAHGAGGVCLSAQGCDGGGRWWRDQRCAAPARST